MRRGWGGRGGSKRKKPKEEKRKRRNKGKFGWEEGGIKPIPAKAERKKSKSAQISSASR